MFREKCSVCLAALILFFLSGSIPAGGGAGHPVKPPNQRGRTADGKLEVNLGAVKSIHVVKSRALGAESQTLLIRLSKPMEVLSTLGGYRRGILALGDHYLPPATWKVSHDITLDELKRRVCEAVGAPGQSTAMLYTGVPMRYASVQSAEFKEMRVYAVVTAGVVSNALRMSVDEGTYYEPGTINILLLTNMQLSPRAMARAILTATEAKTACLQDLDIRSSAGPARQATGTGTDNLIVLSGQGRLISSAGGHSRMGQLIARAVYEAVQEAIRLENGIRPGRDVLARLKERKIDLSLLAQQAAEQAGIRGRNLPAELEKLLKRKRIAGFMESSFALSDSCERGLVSSLDLFEEQCRQVAREIAGRPVHWNQFPHAKRTPRILRQALDALLNGLVGQQRKK